MAKRGADLLSNGTEIAGLNTITLRFFKERLVREGQQFHSFDFATHMHSFGLSVPEAMSATNDWIGRGLIRVDGYHKITLTPAGVKKVKGKK